MTYTESKKAGMVTVGEWGWASATRLPGFIVCMPADRDAVTAAYDAIEEGDSSPEVLDGVKDAGGQFCEDDRP